MLLPKEILEEFDELMSQGKTEKAIVLLKKALKNRKALPPGHLRTITLLSGQYHNWEEEKMQGVKQDSAEYNRINRELMILADNLRNPGEQSQPYSPPPQPTPDPIGVVYQQPQAPHPRPTTSKSSGVVKYVTWFFVGLGVLAFIGLIMEMDNEEIPPVNPAGTETEVTQPPIESTTPGSSTPAPQNIVPPAAQPRPASPAQELPSMTKAIRDKMLDLSESNDELTPDDLLPIDAGTVRNMFGNTTWFHANYNYVYFDPSGTSGTYLQGGASFQILYKTVHGFYIGQYAELTTGDSGYLAIAPVSGNEPLTIFAESEVMENVTAVANLTRQ